MTTTTRLLLGGLTAVFATACASVLGKFEVGACPTGQVLEGETCVPAGGPTNDDPSAKSCTDSKAPACDEKRVCSDSTGLAVCICKPEFTGGECGPCGAGLQDNNADGTCEKTCVNAAPTCGTHAACADTTGTPKCTCTTGYGDADGTCTFNAGPADSEFSGSSSAWQVTKGAVDTADAGDAVGIVRLNACTEWGSLSQTFDMPAAADAEPLALKMRARSTCSDSSCYNPAGFTTSMSMDQFDLPPSAWKTLSLCVGQRAFGPGVNLRIFGLYESYGYGFCNGAATDRKVDFDSIALVPDPSCPAASTVVNGNFEANGGWKADATASVDPLIGNNASKAGIIKNATKCNESYAGLGGTLSFPMADVPNLALKFTHKGTNLKPMFVDIGANNVAVVTGSGTYQDVRICVPDAYKGITSTVKFRNVSTLGTSGACADADVREHVIDDIQFVSAPDLCDTTLLVDDGGFERLSGPTTWSFTSGNGGSSYASNFGSSAHGGTRIAYMYQPATAYAYARTQALITVPNPVGTAGPAVKFFSKVTAAVNGSYTASAQGFTPGAGNSGPSVSLAASTVWTETKMCLPPAAAGRLFALTFGAQGPSTVTTYGSLYVDDVTLTTDATCPATP